MDFRLSINFDGKVQTFEQFEDLIQAIRLHLAEWNNFYPDKAQEIIVVKEKSETSTIGVNVHETTNTEEKIS